MNNKNYIKEGYKKNRYAINNKTGCWSWLLVKNKKGYGQVGYCGKIWQAHRLSYIKFVGEIPKGMCVLHKCDNPSCVNPEYLFLGTDADNARDRKAKGRNADFRGSKNPNFRGGREIFASGGS